MRYRWHQSFPLNTQVIFLLKTKNKRKESLPTCGELHLEALLPWFVELWSGRRAATSAVSDGTEFQRAMGKKKKDTHLQDQSTLYNEKVPLCGVMFSDISHSC